MSPFWVGMVIGLAIGVLLGFIATWLVFCRQIYQEGQRLIARDSPEPLRAPKARTMWDLPDPESRST